MLEKIILKPENAKVFREIMNDNHEYLGTFLAGLTNVGMILLKGLLVKGGKLDANEVSKDDEKKFLEEMNYQARLAKDNPKEYAIIQMHTHGRKFGELIPEYSPYWSINCTVSHQAGKIVCSRFYVSTCKKKGGDDLAFKEMAEIHVKYGISFFHLFVHPKYKSEGTVMSENKIQFTGYKFNPDNIGNVEEIPVSIE